MQIRKRTTKIGTVLTALSLFISCACACVSNVVGYTDKDDDLIGNGTLSVEYVNVEQGDCIHLFLPDGKTMLIDTGAKQNAISKHVNSIISKYSNNIDYLILTHTGIDHVGNAQNILKTFAVKNAFIPKVANKFLVPTFNDTVSLLKQSKVNVQEFDDSLKFESEYFIAFLNPQSHLLSESFYNDFNLDLTPSNEQMNNISAVIYLEYRGVRFLFTGDAGKKVEERIRLNYSAGLYDERVKLEKIDFLKVAHHGSDSTNTSAFLELTTPKNAIISVGAGNVYNLPSTNVLERLCAVKSTIYRTDVNGDVCVRVNSAGEYRITTDV